MNAFEKWVKRINDEAWEKLLRKTIIDENSINHKIDNVKNNIETESIEEENETCK